MNDIEEIDVMHMSDMSETAKNEITKIVKEERPQSFKDNFKGFVEVRMVSSSPMRIESIEPIEGTDVDWIKKKNEDSGIDITDIF